MYGQLDLEMVFKRCKNFFNFFKTKKSIFQFGVRNFILKNLPKNKNFDV
jgi:hypothetical protein